MALHACGCLGLWKRAMRLLRTMRQAGVMLDSSDYESVMKACTGATAFDQTLRLFEEMLQSGPEPSPGAYGYAVSACREKVRWQMALHFLMVMKLRGHKLTSKEYSDALRVLAMAGQDHAADLLHEMHEDAVAPDVLCYNCVISSMTGGLEQVSGLFQEMEHNSLKPNRMSYCCAIQMVEQMPSEWATILHLLGMMHSERLHITSSEYKSAVHSCTKSGKWESVLVLLDRLVPPQDHYEVQAHLASYNTAVLVCTAAGQWEQATRLLLKMEALPDISLPVSNLL